MTILCRVLCGIVRGSCRPGPICPRRLSIDFIGRKVAGGLGFEPRLAESEDAWPLRYVFEIIDSPILNPPVRVPETVRESWSSQRLASAKTCRDSVPGTPAQWPEKPRFSRVSARSLRIFLCAGFCEPAFDLIQRQEGIGLLRYCHRMMAQEKADFLQAHLVIL